MAHARRLTTAELGGDRYATASDTGLWPVEVRYYASDGAKPIERLELKAASQTLPFARDTEGDWIVFVSLPAGKANYTVHADGTKVATGRLDVEPPMKPLSYSLNVQSLRHSVTESGANVHPNAVHFRFVERVFAVKEMFVESPALSEPLRLAGIMDGRKNKIFVRDTKLPEGTHKFRFRVVLKEPARPDAAPFTALGWDPANSGSKGLATWMQTVVVEKGEGGMSDAKAKEGADARKVLGELSDKVAAGAGAGNIAAAKNIVKTDAAAKAGNGSSKDFTITPKNGMVTSTSSKDSAAKPSATNASGGISSSANGATEVGSSDSPRGFFGFLRSGLRPREKIGLGAVVAIALVDLVFCLASGQGQAGEGESLMESSSFERSDMRANSSNKFSHRDALLEHAKGQQY